MLNSREYAQKLRVMAEWLDGKPEFEIDSKPFLYVSYYTKEAFVAAVRALKPGTKEVTDGGYPEIKFHPTDRPEDMMVQLRAPRDKVCHKVREAKWECEPLLTVEEEAELTPASEEVPF